MNSEISNLKTFNSDSFYRHKDIRLVLVVVVTVGSIVKNINDVEV